MKLTSWVKLQLYKGVKSTIVRQEEGLINNSY